jgi:hypothetical protein
MNTFLTVHSELKKAPNNIKQYRFDHFEKLRQKTIEQVKAERQKIIEEQNNLNAQYSTSDKTRRNSQGIMYHSQSAGNLSVNQSNNNSTMTAAVDSRMEKMLQEEQKNIEKIKTRQKIEIQSIIEGQIKAEMIKKNAEEKERRIKEKERQMKEELLKRQQENEELRKKKEKARQNELMRLENEKQQKIKLKQEKEEKKLRELMEQETKRREQMRLKAEEEMNKVKAHKSQLDLFKQSQEELINKKRLLAEQKEREHKEQLEKIRLERMQIAETNRIKKEQALQNSRKQVQINLEKIRIKINTKQKNNEKKLEEFYLKREISLQKLKEQNAKKRNDILTSIKQAEKLDEEKKKKYFERQERLEQSVFLKEMEKTEHIRTKSVQSSQHYQKILETRNELDNKANIRKQELMLRMEEMDKRIKTKRLKEEEQSIQKLEEGNAKQYEKDVAIQRMKKIKEYKDRLRMEEIEEKEKRIEEFKNEQKKMTLIKMQLSQDIQKQKQELMDKFDMFIRQKRDIDSEIVKELFPDDVELYNKIKAKMEGQKSKPNSATTNQHPNSEPQTQSNAQKSKVQSASTRNIKEKEVEKKVEEFRSRLRTDLDKVIQEEKIKEQERINEYEKATNNEQKQQIEKKNALERANSSKRVNEMQNELNKKVKQYEDKLKQEYGIY